MEDIFYDISSCVPKALPTFVRNQYDSDCIKILNLVEQRWQNAELSLMLTSVDKYLQYTVGENSQPSLELIETLVPIAKKLWFISMYNIVHELKNCSNVFTKLDPEMDHIRLFENRLTLKIRVRSCKLLNTILESCMQLLPSIWEKDNKSRCQYFNSKFDFINVDVLLKAFEDYFRCDYTTRIAVSYTKRRCWITCVVRLSSLVRRIWLYRRDIGNYLLTHLFKNPYVNSHMYNITKPEGFQNNDSTYNVENFNFNIDDEIVNQSGRCEIFYKFRILLLLCPNSTFYDLLLNRNLIKWWEIVNGDSVTSWNPMFFTFFFRAAKFAWANGSCVCNFFNDKIPIIFNILYNSFLLPNKAKVTKYKEVMPGEYACLLPKSLKLYKKASKLLILILHPPNQCKSSNGDASSLHNIEHTLMNTQDLLNSLNNKHMDFTTNNTTTTNGNGNNSNNNTTNNNNNQRYDLFEYIKCLVNVLYPYTHPSNNGKWSLSISLLVKYIMTSYSHRIIRERSMISGIYNQQYHCLELDNSLSNRFDNLKLSCESDHNTNTDNTTNDNNSLNNCNTNNMNNTNYQSKLDSMVAFDRQMCELVYGICIQGMFSKNIQICNNYEETIKRICYMCPQDYLESTVSRMLDSCTIVNEPNQLLGSLRLFTQLSPLIVKYLPDVLPKLFQLLLQFISLSEPFMTTQSLILISLLLSYLKTNTNRNTNQDFNKSKFLNGFGLGVFSSFVDYRSSSFTTNTTTTTSTNGNTNLSNNNNTNNNTLNNSSNSNDGNTNCLTKNQFDLHNSDPMCLKCSLEANLFKCCVPKNLDFEYVKQQLSNNTCTYLEMVLFLENYCLCSRDSNPCFDSPVNANKHKNRVTTEEKLSVIQIVTDVINGTNLMIQECLNEWSIQYFETILDLCSNSSKINLKGSSLMNTVEVSTFLLMRSSLLNLLNKVDEDTLVVLINKLLKFVNNYSYKIEIVKYVISLLSCFSYVNSRLVLKQCFNTIEHNINTCFSNDTPRNSNNGNHSGSKTNGYKKEVDNRLLWYLNCLASVVRFSNTNVLKYKDRILQMLKTGLAHHSKQVFKLTAKILYRLSFSSYHLYVVYDDSITDGNTNTTHSNTTSSSLVDSDLLTKLGVSWHYPSKDESDAYVEFVLLMADQVNFLLTPFYGNEVKIYSNPESSELMNGSLANGKHLDDDDEFSLFNRVNRIMILLKYLIKSVLLVDFNEDGKSEMEFTSGEPQVVKATETAAELRTATGTFSSTSVTSTLFKEFNKEGLFNGNFNENNSSFNLVEESTTDLRTMVELYVIHVVLKIQNYMETNDLVVDNINEKITKLVNFMVSKDFYSNEVTANSMEALFNSLKKKVTISTSIISTKPMIKYLSFHYGINNNSYLQDVNEVALVTLIQDFYYHYLNLRKLNPRTNHFSTIRTQYKKDYYVNEELNSDDNSSSDGHMDLDDQMLGENQDQDLVEGIQKLNPYNNTVKVSMVGKELLDLLIEKMCLNNYENVSSNSQQVLKNVITVYGNTKYYVINSLLTHLNDLLNSVLEKSNLNHFNNNNSNGYNLTIANNNNSLTQNGLNKVTLNSNELTLLHSNGMNNSNADLDVDNDMLTNTNSTKETKDNTENNGIKENDKEKELDGEKEKGDKDLMLEQILENIVSFFDISVLNYIVVNTNLLEKFFLFMMKVISLSNNKDLLMNKYDMLFIQFLNLRESPFNSDAYVNANYYSIDGTCSYYGTHGSDKVCDSSDGENSDGCKVLRTDRYRKALKRTLKKVGTLVVKHWRSRLYYSSLLLIYNNQLKSEQFFTNFHLEICRDSTNHYVLSLSLQGLLVVLETLNLSRSGRCLSGEPSSIKDHVVVNLLDKEVVGRVFRTLVYSNHETIMNSVNTGTSAGSTSTSTMAYNIVMNIIKFDRSWPRNRVPNNSNSISRHNFSLAFQYFKLIIHHKGIEAIDVVFDILNELSDTPQSYPENHITFIEIVGGLLKCSMELSEEMNHKLWNKLHPILKNELNNIVYDRICDYMDIFRLVFEKLHRLNNDYISLLDHDENQFVASDSLCFKYIINFILNYEVNPIEYNYENVLLLENNKDDVTGYNLIIIKQLKLFISFLQEFTHESFTYILTFAFDEVRRNDFLSKLLRVLLLNLFNESQKIRDEISFILSYLLSIVSDKFVLDTINDYVVKSLEPDQDDKSMELEFKRVKGVLNLINVLHNLSVPTVKFDNVELYLDFSLNHLTSDNVNVADSANKCVFNIINYFNSYDKDKMFSLYKVLLKNVKNQTKVKLISISLLDVLYKSYCMYVKDSDVVGLLISNYIKLLTDTTVREISKNNLTTIIITLNESCYDSLTNVFIKSINDYNLKGIKKVKSKNDVVVEKSHTNGSNGINNNNVNNKENKSNGSTNDDLVVGVYGLISLISTAPYHIPNWLPNVLVELAKCGGSKYPLDIRNVVQKTLQEFFKNHVDAWEQIHANRFTKEQLELLDTYKGSPIYFN